MVDLCRKLTERGHEIFVAMRPTAEWRDRLNFLPPERFAVSIRNPLECSCKRIRCRQRESRSGPAMWPALSCASVAVRSVKGVKLVLTRHVMFPLKPFHRFALRNVDAAIAVSPAVSAELIRIFPQDRVHVISNGIELSSAPDDLDRAGETEFRQLHAIPEKPPLDHPRGTQDAQRQRDFFWRPMR